MYINGIKINELLRINIKYIKSVDGSICCLCSAAGTEMYFKETALCKLFEFL